MRENTKGDRPHIYTGVNPLLAFLNLVLALTSMSFKEMIGGFLKIYWSYSWFCIRFHFFIQAAFIVDTEGWYGVTNGNISFSSLLFLF